VSASFRMGDRKGMAQFKMTVGQIAVVIVVVIVIVVVVHVDGVI